MRLARPGLVLTLLLGLLASCATTTKMKGSWRDEAQASRPLGKIMVLGISDETNIRNMFESHFARALRSKGLDATPAFTVLPKYGQKVEREQLKATVAEGNFDSVLVTRPLTRDVTDRYMATTGHPTWYGGFYGYYDQAYNLYNAPSDISERWVYDLETNLYETKNATLVWTAVSETVDPKSLIDGVKSFSQVVAKTFADEWPTAP